MSILLALGSVLVVSVLVVFIVEVMRLCWYITIVSAFLTHRMHAFERKSPTGSPRILFVGDSTGHGTGASNPALTIAGRLAEDFPGAHVENWSRGGLKIGRVVGILDTIPTPDRPYNLAIIMVGGMDIVHWTRFSRLETGLRKALHSAKRLADHVVYIGPNNAGLAPLFHYPLNTMIRVRGSKGRSLFCKVCTEEAVPCVSLYQETRDALSASGFYAADKSHPSDAGYDCWYQQIRPALHEMLDT